MKTYENENRLVREIRARFPTEATLTDEWLTERGCKGTGSMPTNGHGLMHKGTGSMPTNGHGLMHSLVWRSAVSFLK
jgi:hypothetical protein